MYSHLRPPAEIYSNQVGKVGTEIPFGSNLKKLYEAGRYNNYS